MSAAAPTIVGPPGETLHPTSARRILATAIVALLVTVLIDAAAVVGLDRHPLNHTDQVVRAKWALLRRQTTPVDTLVLGDSTGNYGVVPDILAARLGGTALNLCTVGDLLAVNDAWMLERYIRDVGPPRTVVLVHAFDVWGRTHNPAAIAQVPMSFGFWNDVRPVARLSIGEEGEVLLYRYVPLYSQDNTISRLFKSPRMTLARSLDMDPSGFLRAYRALPDEVLKDSAFQIAQIERAKGDEPVSAENREALDFLSALAQRHHFDVYVSHSPLYEGLWANARFRQYHDRLDDALLAIAASRPRLRIIPGPPRTFPADRMTNVDHLTEEGARSITESLAAEIATRRDGRAMRYPAEGSGKAADPPLTAPGGGEPRR